MEKKRSTRFYKNIEYKIIIRNTHRNQQNYPSECFAVFQCLLLLHALEQAMGSLKVSGASLDGGSNCCDLEKTTKSFKHKTNKTDKQILTQVLGVCA